MISAIILVKNEEDNISRVIEHLSWTDEQIVIDNGSTDDTAKKARTAGGKVYSVPEMDFSKMRNLAAEKAAYEWILYIDTDEEISPSLRSEILQISKTKSDIKKIHAYRIMRKNYYFGRYWPYSDGMIRLIYKPALYEWYGDLHETAKINGNVDVLKNVLIHRTHNTLEDMVSQTNDWSIIEAKLRFDTHHPEIVPWRLFRVFITGFLNSYISQGGWRAGSTGIIESLYQGFSLFITYAKLWEMQQNVQTNT